MPKATRTLPSAEYLHQCFEYDAKAGGLWWKRRLRNHFISDRSYTRWNGMYPGSRAGWQNPQGYWFVSLDGKDWHIARITYKMHFGIDVRLIDHVDRDRANNRIGNLRAATYEQSNQNREWKIGGTGFLGVSPSRQRFAARIWTNGKSIYLGCFGSAEEAGAAYREASIRIQGEFSPFHESTLEPPTTQA